MLIGHRKRKNKVAQDAELNCELPVKGVRGGRSSGASRQYISWEREHGARF